MKIHLRLFLTLFLMSQWVFSFPLPPKEIYKKINEKQISSAKLIRAEKYEILDSSPRWHGGVGYDRVRKRIRILDSDARIVRAYGVDEMSRHKDSIGSGMGTQIHSLNQLDQWIYLDQINGEKMRLNHAQGRFELSSNELRFIPENPEIVFWQIKAPAVLTGANRLLKNGSIMAWSQNPASLVYLPPAAQFVSISTFETEGEWIRFFDCPDGERFVGVQNYKNNYFRIVFFYEALLPVSYSLFDISPEKNNMPQEITQAIMWGDCTNYLVVGSQGVSRLVFNKNDL
jgi:hypothetical protein